MEDNKDSKCFSVGTKVGFRIYNTEPFKLNFERRKQTFYNYTLFFSYGRRNLNGNNALQN